MRSTSQIFGAVDATGVLQPGALGAGAMALSDPALVQFQEAAARFISLAGYDAIDLGAVWAESDSGPVALRVRLTLCRHDMAVANATGDFQASPLHAVRRLVPVQALERLLDGLAEGRLRFDAFEENGPELRIAVPDGGRLAWSFHEHGVRMDPEVEAHHYGSTIAQLLRSSDEAAFDRLVAATSRHEIASLKRLFRRYVDREFNSLVDMTSVELSAPWPLTGLIVMPGDDRLSIATAGFSGLPTDRFVLNVEGEPRDRRFISADVRWTERVAAGGRSSVYESSVPIEGRTIAVNLYFDGLPEIRLRQHAHEFREVDARAAAGTLVSPPNATNQPEPPSLANCRLASLEIDGFRALRHVALDLERSPLTVVVGPNQAGKSTLVDALRFLRQASEGGLQSAITARGGIARLITRGQVVDGILLRVTIRSAQQRLRYGFRLNRLGAVTEETFEESGDVDWRTLYRATDGVATFRGREIRSTSNRELLLAQVRDVAAFPELELIRGALGSLALFPGFQVSGAAGAAMRLPRRPEPGARLHELGDNLATVLYSMRDETPAVWARYLEISRIAFPLLADLRFPPIALGQVQLTWQDRETVDSFDASELSDGTLAFLANLAALAQGGSSLVAIDEPEQHLHPEALYRLVGAARSFADRQPVLFTTQSDRLLEFLDEIPEAIVVARRGADGTELVRPEPTDLHAWLEKFSLAEMRSELESWGRE